MRKGSRFTAQMRGRHAFITVDSLGYLRLPVYLIGYAGKVEMSPDHVQIHLVKTSRESRQIFHVPVMCLHRIFPERADDAATRRSMVVEVYKKSEGPYAGDYFSDPIAFDLTTYARNATRISRRKDQELGFNPLEDA